MKTSITTTLRCKNIWSGSNILSIKEKEKRDDDKKEEEEEAKNAVNCSIAIQSIPLDRIDMKSFYLRLHLPSKNRHRCPALNNTDLKACSQDFHRRFRHISVIYLQSMLIFVIFRVNIFVNWFQCGSCF